MQTVLWPMLLVLFELWTQWLYIVVSISPYITQHYNNIPTYQAMMKGRYLQDSSFSYRDILNRKKMLNWIAPLFLWIWMLDCNAYIGRTRTSIFLTRKICLINTFHFVISSPRILNPLNTKFHKHYQMRESHITKHLIPGI